MSKSNIKTSAVLSAALLASMGLSQAANADTSAPLFAATDLGHGYMINVGEGKCGEGKCGADKKKEEDKKDAEGKCGEGKCGGDKKAEGKKDPEGKCGEGKCGSV